MACIKSLRLLNSGAVSSLRLRVGDGELYDGDERVIGLAKPSRGETERRRYMEPGLGHGTHKDKHMQC